MVPLRKPVSVGLILTGITASTGISVTQLLGMCSAGVGRYQARVNAWTCQRVR